VRSLDRGKIVGVVKEAVVANVRHMSHGFYRYVCLPLICTLSSAEDIDKMGETIVDIEQMVAVF
jgi:hypothetical protein